MDALVFTTHNYVEIPMEIKSAKYFPLTRKLEQPSLYKLENYVYFNTQFTASVYS